MKIFLIITLYFLLSSCTSSTGDVSIYSVSEDKGLTSPLINASKLSSDPDIIYKTNETHALEGNDTFAIYLTDTYLRYLPDIGGTNEVLIVAEFEEVVSGTSNDTITKILGPFESIADATRAPFFNKALYGPKRMESDILSVKLKVYEYDLDENAKVGSIIDFISMAGEALSLSNPITTQEIKVAKEVAKSVSEMNDNDLVFQFDLDFVAGDSHYSATQNVNILPLKAGEIVFIKKEVCSVARCYGYFNKGEGIRNPVGYAADILLSPITAITIGLTDTPAGSSLSVIKPEELKVKKKGVVNKIQPDNFEEYIDKTWLRLSIVKGGDPKLWEKRKLLYPVENKINELLTSPNGIQSQNLQDGAMTALSEAITQLHEIEKDNIKLVSNNSLNNVQYILAGSTSSVICLDIPVRFELTSNLPLLNQSQQSLFPSHNKYKCYTLVPSDGEKEFKKGTLYFQINYTYNNVLKSHIATVEVVDKLPI